MNTINKGRPFVKQRICSLLAGNLLVSLLLLLSCCNQRLKSVINSRGAPETSKVWVADNGDGTYKNPILHADYSDPDVIRVGNDYYLVASSFNCVPGLPVLHSNDLVNWSIVSYALPAGLPGEIYDKPQHGKGVWAPSIRYYKHEFYIYYPDPDFGIYVVKTKDIFKEQWSAPELVLPGKGIIDPCPLWDDDGKVYLVTAWAASRAGVNSLLTVFQMNSAGTKVIDMGTHVFDGHNEQKTIEGPKIYKKNGMYYILAPAGGVATGWQVALRSRNIYGPYESKIVLAQGKTNINGPHQGALVETQKGENWFFHFQDKGPYGRVLHLEPVKWVDGWPLIGVNQDGNGKGEPVTTYSKPVIGSFFPKMTPPESDEFNSGTLGLQWQWQANQNIAWSALMKGAGYLRLFAWPREKGSENLWDAPNLLLQKFPGPDFSVITRVSYSVEWDVWQGKKAGLIVMGNDYACLAIGKNAQGFTLSQTVCNNADQNRPENIIESKQLSSATVYLKVTVSAPDAVCQFSYSEDGRDFKDIGQPFFAKPDKWTGAKVGIFCTAETGIRLGGYADFDWFRVGK